MAQTIKLKRSAITGRIPNLSNLELGEIAINTYDGKLYIKKDVAGVEEVVEVGKLPLNPSFDSVFLAGAAGPIVWNTVEEALDIPLNSDVTLQVGQEQVFRGKATETILNGDVVMFVGAQGDHLLIAKADMSATGFRPEHVIGLATQDFLVNDFGFVTSFGKVRGLNTTAFNEGDILYLDAATPGALTTAVPAPPNHSIQLCAVVRSHVAEGTYLVRPRHFPDTDEVIEGLSNLYFTNARAVAAVAAADQYVKNTGDTVTGNVTLDSSADLIFRDKNGTFPTNSGKFVWDLNNDSAAIYAQQPSSDQIDFFFKITDNAASTDRFVFWIDDYRGAPYDKYPAQLDGSGVYLSVPVSASGVKDLANSRMKIPYSGNPSIDNNTIWHAGNFNPNNYLLTSNYVDDYVTSAVFNTTNGILTLTRAEGETVAVDLDGRYSQTATNTTYSVSAADVASGKAIRLTGSNSVTDDVILAGGNNVSLTRSGDTITINSADAPADVVTTLSKVGNDLRYVNEAGTTATIDLTSYLDDTNLARIVDGTLSDSGILTVTRDDSTTFDIDLSLLLDDTNLARIVSAGWNTGNGVLTLTRNDGSTIPVDLDNRYLQSYIETDTLASVTARGATTSAALTLNGAINVNNHINFNANGNSLKFDTDGDRDTLSFLRNGTRYWRLQHSANAAVLNFIPENGASNNIQVNGSRILTTADSSSFLTSYTETDTLQSVTTRGNNTNQNIILDGSAAIIFNTTQQGLGGEVGLRGNGEGFDIYEPEESSKIWLTIADDPQGNNSAFKVNSTTGMQPVWHGGNFTPSDYLLASNYVDNYVDSAAFNTSNGVLTLGRTGSLPDLTVDLDNRYKLIDDTYRWELNDVSNLTGSRWYKVATVNTGNGGLRIEGTFSNHVESFGTQTVDLSIFGREGNDSTEVEIVGSIDVAATESNTGILVLKATDSSAYHSFDVYVAVSKYAMVQLDFTKTGLTSLLLPSVTTYVTTEPTGISVEFDGTSLPEGSYVVQDSQLYDNYHSGNINPVTGLTHDTVNKELDVTFANGTTQSLDLTQYIDDTNLARITSGTMSGSGIATFTRDDNSTFTVDMSVLLDDTNLSRIVSASWNTGNGVLTLTRNDASTINVDLDNRYLQSYTETDTLQSVTTRGNTTTNDIIISKNSPKLRLYDTNSASGSFPTLEFETANSQGISLYLNEFDGELPLAGYGLVVGPSSSNTQFPVSGDLSLNVLGEIYTGGETLASLHKVFHDAYHPNADKWTTARTNTVTLTGDVTGSGSASVDGSGNWTVSIPAVVGNDSHDHTRLLAVDNRAMKPSTSGIQSGVPAIKAFFSSGGGMTGSANTDYKDVLVLDTYADSSGGGPNAITFDKGSAVGDPQVHIWKGAWGGTTWGTGQRVFADNYHPNADKWTTARTNTVALSGDVTGSGSASVDGSGNWTVSVPVTVSNNSHNHTTLTGVTSIGFNAQSTDSASISTTINGTSTYFDFNLTDDNNTDWWRWRFTPSGSAVYDAMVLKPTSNGNANLIVSGSITADSFSGSINYNQITNPPADVDNYVDSLAFNTSNGVLTLGRTGSLSNLTVDLDGRYQSTLLAPVAPSITSTSVVNETIEIVFSQSSTSGIDYYEIWSDGGTGSYSLIAKITEQDFAASMSVVDTTFIAGTISYRVFAVKNGIYSTAATTNRLFTAPSLDVSNLQVIPDLNVFYIGYNIPESRFADHVEIYADTNVSSSSLARVNASLIYSGNTSNFTYNISAAERDSFHQFWVEVV